MNDYQRMIPREPLLEQHEPATWKNKAAVITMLLFAGVLLWATADEIIQEWQAAHAKPEPVQERPAQDVTGQIRTLERMIADAQQLNRDIRELDQQIRKGIK